MLWKVFVMTDIKTGSKQVLDVRDNSVGFYMDYGLSYGFNPYKKLKVDTSLHWKTIERGQDSAGVWYTLYSWNIPSIGFTPEKGFYGVVFRVQIWDNYPDNENYVAIHYAAPDYIPEYPKHVFSSFASGSVIVTDDNLLALKEFLADIFKGITSETK